ncbi:MAG: tetratricopeptide repeat protein [Candidatus Rokubacteria bacterium]|nr:tetratricopeptide repeat protein [Candidatus Rokubacteria bacterium]
MNETQPERVFTLRELTRLLRLTARRATQLRRLGLLRAEGERYRFRDLVACRVAAALLEAGASVKQVREGLEGARRLAPDTEMPLTELRLVVADRRIVVEQGRLRFDARTGQGLLGFPETDLAREAAESLSWGMVRPLIPPAEAAEAWFARASAWDGDPEQWEAAVDAYERVLAVDPGYAAAWNNLGLLQHRMGHYERAGQCYEAAFAADETCAQAAFNLGSLHEDLGDVPASITWYRRALEMDPDYADAHFNLAGVLGKAGRAEAAVVHWRRYLDLDAGSAWAQIARSHLCETEGRSDGEAPAGEGDE